MKTDEYCKLHTPNKLPYIPHHEWVERKYKQGHKQRFCSKCKHWLFKCEWGNDLKQTKSTMKTAEETLREYCEFFDVNGSDEIHLLPLTITDAMQEYAQIKIEEYQIKLINSINYSFDDNSIINKIETIIQKVQL